mmetsp:Transcript_20685/g.58145  ORF Transcript_20685/g.58145 Transcript_20685/m.58145 type:complete len:542 (-) Transcript_20685:477-2102(-)
MHAYPAEFWASLYERLLLVRLQPFCSSCRPEPPREPHRREEPPHSSYCQPGPVPHGTRERPGQCLRSSNLACADSRGVASAHLFVEGHDRAVLAEGSTNLDLLHKLLGARYWPPVHGGCADVPAPGLEELAALLEPLQRRRVRGDAGAVAGRDPVAAADGGLLLGEVGAWIAADVRRAVLEVVEARHREVHVELALLTAKAPRRAAVLLHDHDHPVLVGRGVGLDEQALPASPAPAVVGAAVVDVGAQDVGDPVRGRPRHPDLLAVHAPAMVVRVHGRVLRRGDVLVLDPGVQVRRVTALATAVPVMRGRHGRLPVLGEVFVVLLRALVVLLWALVVLLWALVSAVVPLARLVGLVQPGAAPRDAVLRGVALRLPRDDLVAHPVLGGRAGPAEGLARVLHEALVVFVLAAALVDAVVLVPGAVGRRVVHQLAQHAGPGRAARHASGPKVVHLKALRTGIPAASGVRAVLVDLTADPLLHRLGAGLLRWTLALALEEQTTDEPLRREQSHENLVRVMHVPALVLEKYARDGGILGEHRGHLH